MRYKTTKMSESDKIVCTLSILENKTSDELRKKEFNDILTRLLRKMSKSIEKKEEMDSTI